MDRLGKSVAWRKKKNGEGLADILKEGLVVHTEGISSTEEKEEKEVEPARGLREVILG